MANEDHDSPLDSLIGKAEGALQGFLSDQEKVDKAKGVAEKQLSKYVDPNQAEQIVDKAEDMLRGFVDRGEDR